MRPKPESAMSIFYLQAIANHSVFDALVRSRSSRFRGDYRSYGKQFVSGIPMKVIDFTDNRERAAHDQIVSCVKDLMVINSRIAEETVPHTRTVLTRRRGAIRAEVESIVSDLYHIADVDGVGD